MLNTNPNIDRTSLPDIITEQNNFVKQNPFVKKNIRYSRDIKRAEQNKKDKVEQATEKYGNEKLLVNKQMIRVGVEDIPNIYSDAIEKKEGMTKFLADLNKIRRVYAQSVVDLPSDPTISQQNPFVKENIRYSRDVKLEF